MTTDSLSLPQLSSSVSKTIFNLSVKSNSKKTKSYVNNVSFGEANTNLKKKDFLADQNVTPALAIYYYASMFPSLYTSLFRSRNSNGNLLQKQSLHGLTHKIYRVRDFHPICIRKKTYSSTELHKLKYNTKFEVEKALKSPLKSQSCFGCSCENDDIKPNVTTSFEKAELPKQNSVSKNYSEENGNKKNSENQNHKKFLTENQYAKLNQEKSLVSEEKNLQAKSKIDSTVSPAASSGGRRNRSMSLSNFNYSTNYDAFARQRRHSATTREPNSTQLLKKSDPSASFSPQATSLRNHVGSLSSKSNKLENFDRHNQKSTENERRFKKDAISSFERYYSSQLEKKKADFARKKLEVALLQNYAIHESTEFKNEAKTTNAQNKTRNNSKQSKYPENRFSARSKGQKSTTGRNVRSASSKEKTKHSKHSIGDNCFDMRKCSLVPKETQTTNYDDCNAQIEAKLTKTNALKSTNYYAPAVIPLLTPDQLVIRDSVEKVRRWMRTLPKHFEKIHHVSSPTQEDH